MKMSFTAIPACQNLFAIIQEESCLKPDFECVVDRVRSSEDWHFLWKQIWIKAECGGLRFGQPREGGV